MSNLEIRAVIKFLTKKGRATADIQTELQEVYGDNAPSYSTIKKWASEFKQGRESLEDDPRSGRPSTSTTDGNVDFIEELVMRERQISVRRVANELGISKTVVADILKNRLGMTKVCTRWVPKLLTPLQRGNRVDACKDLLHQCLPFPDSFLCRIVTGDESWIHLYDPLSQSEAKQWKHRDEPTPSRPRQQKAASKVMLTIFWDCQGVLLTDYLPRGQSVTSAYYGTLIERLRAAILQKRRGKITRGILLLHDNAPVHKGAVAQAAIRAAGFHELCHPTYSPDIAPSDYHLFSRLKRALRGKNFDSNEMATDAVESFLRDQIELFFRTGIFSLRDRWQRVIDAKGNYIE
jgi:histone-lysine N-methyltransferase SETMAR